MANGNEIDRPRRTPTDLFLQDVQVPSRAGDQLYDLEQEFEQTRKNKSLWLWLAIGGFVAVTIAASVAFTMYLDSQARQSEVEIAGFQTLQLRDLLDEVANRETELRQAQRELDSLRQELQLEIQRIQDERDREIEVIRAEAEAGENVQARIAQVRQEAQQRIQEVRSELEPQIRAQEQKVTGLQEQMAQYDESVVDRVEEAEQEFNNQLRLARLRMQDRIDEYKEQIDTLQSEYEAQIADLREHNEELETALEERSQEELTEVRSTLDPTFESGTPAAQVLNRVETGAIPGPGATDASLMELLQESDAITEEEVAALQTQVDSVSTLFARLQEIPYENSVPEALNAAGSIVHSAFVQLTRIHNDNVGSLEEQISTLQSNVSNLESTISELQRKVSNLENELSEVNQQLNSANSLIAQLREQRDRLSSFRHAVRARLEQRRENGFIIDARNPEQVRVQLSDLHGASDGTEAFVFRNDDQYVGKIRLSVEDDTFVTATVLETVEERSIRPFDMVLMELTTNAQQTAVARAQVERRK